MADTVATLGFAVDSSGLDQAKQKLGETTTTAKQTEDQAKKTGDAISNIGKGSGNGPQQAAVALRELDNASKVAGTSVGVLDSMAKRSGVSIADMAVRVAAAKTGLSATATASHELGAALNIVAPAARSASSAIFAKSAAVTELHTAIRAVSPVLNAFGGGLGTILSSATLVRGSLALLAGIAGTELTVALAKAGDQTFRSQKLFEGITGSANAGATALSAAKNSARSVGVDFDTFSGALQKMAQGQTLFASKTLIYANTADQASKENIKLSGTLETLGGMMKSAGATFDEKSRVFSAFSTSIQRTGDLTADAFQQIRDASIKTARQIADAFGYKNIEEFQQQLEKTPITLDEIQRKFAEIKPKVSEASDQVKTFGQATEELSTEWKRLLETLANVGAFNVVITAISTITNALNVAAYAAEKLGPALRQIGTAPNGQGTALSNTDAMGVANPYGDIQAPAPDTPGFASGGSFVVGGSGGTDSQAVTFKATPGEVVTIATPDQAASGIASLTAVSGGTDIGDLLKEQTKQIVEAINGLKTTSPASTSATLPVTLVGTSGGGSGGGGVPAFGAVGAGSGGGGGGGSSAPFKALEDSIKRRDQELAARERELGGGSGGGGSAFSGMAFGQAGVLRGFNSSRGGAFPTRAPTGPFGGGYTINGADFSGGGGFDESGFTETYGTPDYYSGGGLTGGNLYDSNPGTFDYTPFDYSQMGSSSFDEGGFVGSFARGGSFTVGGDGGTDTTPVRMFATKGERITITPPGVRPPSGVRIPTGMLNPAASTSAVPAKPVQNIHKKEVTINVQAGISADTFLRSRAQISRGI